VAKKQRSIADDIMDGVRRLIDDLEQVLDPQKQQERQQVPVPIPVEPDRRRHPRDPYRR
jgi:hypothetical protein